MAGVIQWVKNMVYYLLLISLVSSLLPSGKYERYVRLFSGAVFLLIVISPLAGSFHLEDKLARAYGRLKFEQDASEFEEKLWGIEDRQLNLVIRQYEEAVSRDIQAMAAADGFLCREAKVRIGSQEGTEEFGRVTGIELVLGNREESGAFGSRFQVWDEGDEAVIVAADQPETVAPVKIQVEEALADQNGRPGRLPETGRAEDGENQLAEGGQEELYGFQRKVAEYYGMEEKDIQITWENEEGELDPSAVRGADPDDYGGTH